MISIIHENKIRTNRGSCYLKMATLNRRNKYITKARTIAISSTNIGPMQIHPIKFDRIKTIIHRCVALF